MSDDRPNLVALRALKLGDLLVAVPALKALRRRFPDHRIFYAAREWLEPIVALVGDDRRAVDELLPTQGLDDPLNWHRGPVDVAVNLHGRGPESTELLELLHPRLRLGHAGPGWQGPEWHDGGLERERWARVATFPDPPDADDVSIMHPPYPSPMPGAAIVHVGAFYGARHWPTERFAAVARELARRGLRVVITGGPADGERAEQTAQLAGDAASAVFAGEGSIPLDHIAALIADARLLVSVDTGVAHLASAFGTPSVVIFGPAPPSEWGPPPGPHIVLTDESLRRGETFADEPDPALLAVSVDEVLAAVDRLLAGGRQHPIRHKTHDSR